MIKFEDITLTNSTSGTNGEAPAGRVEGGGAGESKDNVGSPEVGNGGAELKSVEQRK